MVSPGFTEDERYTVREITGYTTGTTSSTARETTSYWVADRDDCYREVATFFSRPRVNDKDRRRDAAYALADRLNAEDRALSLAPPT